MNPWFPFIATLLGGGAMGAIITAVVTNFRNRQQPIGYETELVEVIKKNPDFPSLRALIMSGDDSGPGLAISNLSMARITIVNKGNQDIVEFKFGVTLTETIERCSPARFFLITRSIELAAKSLHLAGGRTVKEVKDLGHDLEAACEVGVLAQFGITLTSTEAVNLKKANQYYEGKGFEYFLFKFPGVSMERSGPEQALSGWRGLPDESVLESLLLKLVTPKL